MHHDVAILGAGFGGSITALIAKQSGMNPILIEKGTHPRFAIGESSTPQANIALAHLADTYNLPQLKTTRSIWNVEEIISRNCMWSKTWVYIYPAPKHRE